MKLVKGLFLVLGITGLFSVHQSDAMADDNSYCVSVSAGKYCFKKGTKPKCPSGCYCQKRNDIEQVKNIDGINSEQDVKNACSNKSNNLKLELEERGIYFCPSSFPSSDEGAKNKTDCYGNSGHYNNPKATVTGCVHVAGGKYCFEKGKQFECPSGCYCKERWDVDAVHNVEGIVQSTVERACSNERWTGIEPELRERGVYYCPKDFPKSDGGLSHENNCYTTDSSGNKLKYEDYKSFYKNYTCNEGEYLPKLTANITALSCSDCPSGKYCPGGTFYTDTQKDQGICNSAHDFSCIGITASISTTAVFPRQQIQHTDLGVSGECEVHYMCDESDTIIQVSSGSFNVLSPDSLSNCVVPNGQSFDGWYVNDNALSSNSYDCAGNTIIFIARFSNEQSDNVQTYTVSYDCGAGTGSPETQTATYNQMFTPLDGDVVCTAPSNMVFNGWKVNGVGNSYITSFYWLYESDKTLYADWVPNGQQQQPDNTTLYNVTYNCGDGTGNPPSGHTATYGQPFVLPAITCTAPANKYFQGWQIPNGTGVITSGTLFTWNYHENKTFVAQWGSTQNSNNLTHVNEGMYLPAGSLTPAYCTSTNAPVYSNQFCPGGDFYPNQNYDQGIYTCVNGGTANAGRTACRVSLDENDLMHGILGQGECWMIENNMDEYRSCVFGGAYDVSMQ